MCFIVHGTIGVLLRACGGSRGSLLVGCNSLLVVIRCWLEFVVGWNSLLGV